MTAYRNPDNIRRRARVEEFQPKSEPRPRLSATPFALGDPTAIPKRKWLYGRAFVRQHLTVTVAPGGIGKSAQSIVEALAMVTGRDLLGDGFTGPALRVWLWNGEDPLDELQRRVAAACIHYGISNADLGGRLFLDSGRDMPIRIASCDRTGPHIDPETYGALVSTVRNNHIDLASLDPLVTVHRVPENSTDGMEVVAEGLAQLAQDTNAAISVVHHTRKPASGITGEVTADDARGGGALAAKARIVRVLNRMTKEEAEQAGVKHHRRYFRLGSDKVNLAPPDEDQTWRYLESVELPNGMIDGPNLIEGDSVGVVVPWQWPNPFDGVSGWHLREVQRRIITPPVEKGQWRSDVQSPYWVGHLVADVTGHNLDNAAHKTAVKSIIKDWIKNGMLRTERLSCEDRKERPCVVLGNLAND